MEKLPFMIHGMSITDQAKAANVGAKQRLRCSVHQRDKAFTSELRMSAGIFAVENVMSGRPDIAKFAPLGRRLVMLLKRRRQRVPTTSRDALSLCP